MCDCLQLSIKQEHQKLMQSCCHSFARDGIWRRILLVFCFHLVSEVCVSELPLAEPRSTTEERKREITNEGTKEEIWKHMAKSYARFVPKFHV